MHAAGGGRAPVEGDDNRHRHGHPAGDRRIRQEEACAHANARMPDVMHPAARGIFVPFSVASGYPSTKIAREKKGSRHDA